MQSLHTKVVQAILEGEGRLVPRLEKQWHQGLSNPPSPQQSVTVRDRRNLKIDCHDLVSTCDRALLEGRETKTRVVVVMK